MVFVDYIKNKELNRKGILYTTDEINKLQRRGTEGLEHFITKAIVFFILRKMNHQVVTEFEVVDCGYGDILDLDTLTNYEIENNPKKFWHAHKQEMYSDANINTVVISVKKLPNNHRQRYKELKNYIHID